NPLSFLNQKTWCAHNTPRACAGWLVDRCTKSCQQHWLYFHTPERERLNASPSTRWVLIGEQPTVILRCEGYLSCSVLLSSQRCPGLLDPSAHVSTFDVPSLQFADIRNLQALVQGGGQYYSISECHDHASHLACSFLSATPTHSLQPRLAEHTCLRLHSFTFLQLCIAMKKYADVP
ncbi:MAG: hypothetical protein ACPIOQ_25670, partial [Promethearchaeia archaeon]